MSQLGTLIAGGRHSGSPDEPFLAWGEDGGVGA